MNDPIAINQKTTVVLGLDFNGPSESLLKQTELLCRRTGMHPHLVHVCVFAPTNIIGDTMIPELADPYRAVESEVKDSDVQLAKLSKEFFRHIAAASARSVVAESAAKGLIDAASECSGGAIIISGPSEGSRRFVPKAFSTTLALMANSHAPVIVFPQRHEIDFAKKDLRVLIADDMLSNSLSSISAAFDFVALLGDAQILHTHVFVGEEEKSLSAIPTDWSTTESGLKTHLRTRARSHGDKFEQQHIRYEAEILRGNPIEELIWRAEAWRADLIAFGQHHFLHRDPFFFGSVSSRKMLACNMPLLIVPQHKPSSEMQQEK